MDVEFAKIGRIEVVHQGYIDVDSLRNIPLGKRLGVGFWSRKGFVPVFGFHRQGLVDESGPTLFERGRKLL